MTAFYVVPNGPQRSSVFFNGFFSDDGLKSLPPIAALVFKFRPKWASHLFVHNVFDGDSKILRKASPPASTLRPAVCRLLCGVWRVVLATLHTQHNCLQNVSHSCPVTLMQR